MRFKPYDTTTEEGRARERLRRVGLSALSSAAARGLGLGASLITVPLTASYLGAERYGLWMTVLSVAGLLSMADLGIGYGVMTLLAEAHGRGDRLLARKLVSNAFVVLVSISVVLVGMTGALHTVIPWERVIGLRGEEAGPATAVAIACFGVGLPLGIAQRVLVAYQEGFAAGLFQMPGSVLSFCCVVLAVVVKSGLVGLVLAVSGPSVIASLITCYVVFRRRMRWLRPRLGDFERSSCSKLLRTSGLFFVLQAAGIVGFGSDTIVLAHICGGAAVAQYAVATKLFSIPQMLLSYVLTPLWPAYGEAIAKGDITWVRRILRRSIVLGVVSMVVAASALVFGGSWLISKWTVGKISVGFLLLFALGLWSVTIAISGPLAAFLNGAKVVAFQVATSSCLAVVNILLSIVLAKSIGVSGVVFGSIVSLLLTTLIPIRLHMPRLLRDIEARAGSH
jgi:O-antigen/teichoic acid export membrane protein